MAIFRKNDDSLAGLLRRVEKREYQGLEQLETILGKIAVEPALKARQLAFMLADTHPKVRSFGVEHIDRIGGDEAAEIYVHTMAAMDDAQLRRELATQLSRIEPNRLLRSVGPLANSKQQQKRETALDIVAMHPRWLDFMTLLKALARDPERAVQLKVMRVLRRGISNPTVRFMLIERVHSDDGQVRREAISALASAPGPDIVDAFFARLGQESAEVESSMLNALSELAMNPEAKLEERLQPMLAHEEEPMRNVAVRLLARMPNRTQVLRSFLIYSRGIATWLRDRAVDSIQKLGGDFVDPLIELMQDDDEHLRVAAMRMAGETGDTRVRPYLEAFVAGDYDWWIRSIACEAMLQFKDLQCVELLDSQINDPDLRFSVIDCLGKIGMPVVYPILLHFLTDESRGVRSVALEAFRGVDDEEVLQAVQWLAVNDKELQVQQRACDILRSTDAGRMLLPNVEQKQTREASPAVSVAIDLEMQNPELN